MASDRPPAIDCHLHVIPPGLTRESGSHEAQAPSVRWEAGVQIIEYRGATVRSAIHDICSIESILAGAAARGVGHVLACPWVQMLGDMEASEPDALRACRAQNQALASLIGPRVSALGTVPMRSPAQVPTELERVMGLGLKGVEVAASVGGLHLGDDRFEPVWAAAERLGALVFVHPTQRGFEVAAMGSYYLANAAGNPLETGLTAAHLVMSGALERHPELRVLLSHGGGALPALRGRLRRAWTVQPPARSRLQDPPDASLKRLLYDTVVHDEVVLRQLIEFTGASQVLMGTDYPFDMALDDPVGLVSAATPDPADREAVLGGNASRLLGIGG
ncbi:MAG: amidohydrolase family protein [Candidatus Dormibacteraceae bacterium]